MILKHSPMDSAFRRAQRGPAAEYEAADYLLVGVLNTLRGMSWQLGQDRKAPKPEPISIPGMSVKGAPKQLGDSMSIEEMDRRLAKYKPR
ncbi:hypothetical protein [Cryobacterium sp. AP23]